ncbi:MAG: M24B family metallopeptidase, partial [Emergencia timonensis]
MRQQLINLRQKMQQNQIDAYLIPTTDYHGSEYVNDYFKCRKYISGFSGSAGTLIITMGEAWLWTDGRYFLQAAKQLEGTGIDLMKMGQPDVPTISEYLEATLTREDCLGFDGRVVDCEMGRQLAEKFKVRWDIDLVGEIWTDRPTLDGSEIYAIPESVTGESASSKLSRVRRYMAEKGADYHLITKMEEIAWLFNLRGNDVANTPVFFSFALIEQERASLYVLDDSADLAIDGIEFFPYLQIFEDLRKLQKGRILLDEEIASYAITAAIPDSVEIISDSDPAELMKALKNPVEIAATKNAHIKDGVAMVNFLYWLKKTIGRVPMSEISAADYLENCRRSQKGWFDLSFGTISGYAGNGAIIHYDPTPETDKELRPEGFLLVDSGGQYEDGTTDITRTIALGPITDVMKAHYTAVLRCNIDLAMAKFSAGTTGAQLDEIARKPLKDMGLDYNHGTGHGVGHILSCHEGPQIISPKGTRCPLYPGMITSDEPGVYIEG